MSSSSAVVIEDNVPRKVLFGAVRWPLEVNMIIMQVVQGKN